MNNNPPLGNNYADHPDPDPRPIPGGGWVWDWGRGRRLGIDHPTFWFANNE